MPTKEELEKMIQKCMRDKGWSRERCQRYIAGGIWGSESMDFVGPTVSDVHIPQPSKKISIKVKQPDTFTIENVPIFKAGFWKNQEYTIDDLEEIVKNTNALIKTNIIEPPLKLGHNESQELYKSDGLPAIGYVARVFRLGDQIFADFVNVPKKIKDLIEKRAYSKVSAEIYEDFTHPETKEKLGKALRAVALLGADIPEVKGLGDIEKLYYTETKYNCITFSEGNLEEVNKAMNIWTLKDVEKYFPCCVEAVKKFMDEKKVDVIDSEKLAEIITKVRLSKLQEGEPECPEGFKWDTQLERCVPMQESEKGREKDEERKICPRGYKWDDAQQKCVPIRQGQENPGEDEENKEDKKEIKNILAQSIFDKNYDDLDDKCKKKIDTALEKIEEVEMRENPKIKVPDEIKDKIGDVIHEPDMIDETRRIQGVLKTKVSENENVSRFQLPGGDPKGWTKESYKSAYESLGGSFTSCVQNVSDVIDNPERYCAWLKYKATGTWPGTLEWRRTESENRKLQELAEKIKKLEKEKYKKMFEELKTKNRNVLLPKFDKYIDIFTENLDRNTIIKFGEKDYSLLELFYKFLQDLVNSKIAIFGELAKIPKEGELNEKFEEEKEKIMKVYSEIRPNENIVNVEIAQLAEYISKSKNISYKDALVEASKMLKQK